MSVRARDLSGAIRRRVGRQKPGAARDIGARTGAQLRDSRPGPGPGDQRERDQWTEDPGVGETCCNVYTADTAVMTTGRLEA